MFQQPRRLSVDLLALIGAFLPFVASWIYFVALAGDERARWVYLAAKGLQFGLPLLWIRRTRTAWQTPERPHRRNLSLGMLSGLAMGGGIVVAYLGLIAHTRLAEVARHQIGGTLANFGIHNLWGYLGMALVISTLHAGLEEFYWRGFVFDRASVWLPPSGAILVSSLAFSSHHLWVVQRYLPAGTFWTLAVPFTLLVAVGGVFWCWLYRRTGSLVPPWISHIFVDAALMFVGWKLTQGLL